MEDKSAIKVVCTQCDEGDFLASEEDKAKPVLFDTPEEAMAFANSLSKKKAGTFGDSNPNQLYECSNHSCGVISPICLGSRLVL